MSNRLNGGLTHGILTMLNTRGLAGARTTEITNAFPSLDGSSNLTYMRRKGLIVKSGLKPTDPWVISADGLQLLSTLEQYTPAIYWAQVWNVETGRPYSASLRQYFKPSVVSSKFGWEQPDYMAVKHFGDRC